MTEIKLCPYCHKKLVPMGERTGGFSGTKAVIGVVVAGPVGAAAGALGKKLVTLQCEECDFTIEMDAKDAEHVIAFGEYWDKFMSNAISMPSVKDVLAYNKTGYSLKGLLNREKERAKIGIDSSEIDAAVASAKQKNEAKAAAKKADIQAEIAKLEQQKAELTQKLGSLGFFKFAEKKATQAEIDALDAQIKDSTENMDQNIKNELDAELKVELARIRAPYVERCRELALETLDEYCPDDEDLKKVARAFYSVLDGEPIAGSYLASAMPFALQPTSLQMVNFINAFGTPFVSQAKYQQKNKNSDGYYVTDGYYFSTDGNYFNADDNRNKRQMDKYNFDLEMHETQPNYPAHFETKYGIKL